MSNEQIGNAFLDSINKRYHDLKAQAEAAVAQVGDEDLSWRANEECNNIAILMQHIAGNLTSRWTEPLTTDGEKPDRQRDQEFESGAAVDRARLMARWEDGWAVLFNTLESFTADDLTKTIQIRGIDHSLVDAINRNYGHTASHVGQILHICKERLGSEWKTLSIPKGQSPKSP